MPPMMLWVRKVRYFMEPAPAPATIGAKVRMIETKRASTMALGPCLSMNSWALPRVSGLKSLEPGRLKSFGPKNVPIR